MAATVKVKFSNLEMPGVRLDFTYQKKKYSLEDNNEYALPIDVIEHLNGLRVPDPVWEEDPDTGQLRHKLRYRNRFNCQILDLSKILERAKGGRPPTKTVEEEQAETPDQS